MKLYFLLVSIVLIQADSVDEEWQKFQTKYSKKFTTSLEENKRFVIFNENYNRIQKHNLRYEEGLVSYKLGINEFSDLTMEEFADKMLMKNKPVNFPTELEVSSLPNVSVPDTFDWREKGAVTNVKNQGHCGACYIFSSLAAVESHYFLKSGKLINLSEQYILDCDPGYDYGCTGGYTKNVMLIIRGYGVPEMNDYYAYDATKHVCRANNATKTLFTNIGYKKLVKTEQQMKIAVGGIYDNPNCGNTNHASLVVGYGTSNGKDYWLVKNSWGPSWGENGYVRMARNKGNQCGVINESLYPLL